MDEIRVGLVDDHAIVRQGLRTMIDKEPDLRVVGRIEAELEGFAHDLLGMLGEPAQRETPLSPAQPMPV